MGKAPEVWALLVPPAWDRLINEATQCCKLIQLGTASDIPEFEIASLYNQEAAIGRCLRSAAVLSPNGDLVTG